VKGEGKMALKDKFWKVGKYLPIVSLFHDETHDTVLELGKLRMAFNIAGLLVGGSLLIYGLMKIPVMQRKMHRDTLKIRIVNSYDTNKDGKYSLDEVNAFFERTKAYKDKFYINNYELRKTLDNHKTGDLEKVFEDCEIEERAQ